MLSSHRASKGLPHPAAPRTAGQPASSLTLEFLSPTIRPTALRFGFLRKLRGGNGRTCRTHPNCTAPQAAVITRKPFIISIMGFVRQTSNRPADRRCLTPGATAASTQCHRMLRKNRRKPALPNGALARTLAPITIPIGAPAIPICSPVIRDSLPGLAATGSALRHRLSR